jgi:hypothetical protein
MNFGIVVEHDRDVEAYSELIRKIRNNDVNEILFKPCQNAPEILKQSVGWLKHFNWHASLPINKALVIIDSDCSDASVWEERLRQIYERSHFEPSFPVHFHATKCELETWLLADENAINQTSRGRGKNKHLGPVNIQFETYRDAKELFQKRLSEAKLPDTPQVYKEIAGFADIQRILARCPLFQQFINKVKAC